jgi:hypothetical protein
MGSPVWTQRQNFFSAVSKMALIERIGRNGHFTHLPPP